ncbi:MAG: trigger factor [Clostridiales bacterium]|jgi:trigger factor|uniref:trigger factor n=1 Tax=Bovifimicola ammoniilytica TaxID=2981720 RepID=UPI0003359186|nr:trigger factor [Bovifimicola ammoniilytica]MBD8942549.1 trigger factor [Clostridiales bacterium]MCU6753047.1 trigger factor [Bovifimicola ammoniilytica]CCZ03151.1 trigger factor [Eubacterium sp. CAG:603]SCJ48775.1 Trigger factor [uncultured Eubacterium sp.]
MSLQVEKLEKNMAKLTIEVSAEEVEKAIEKAYQKQKSRISVPGFRKGKVPRKMVEKMYGVGVFYEDAVNDMIPTAYEAAVKESELEIVSQPKIDVVQIEAGKEFIFTAEVAVKPEVELGEYKGVEVPKSDVSVSDEEIMAEIDKEREQNSRIITVDDRAVEDGDMTVIDFEGFVDGVAFEGGKGTDYPLTIGSHSFIDTFEEQLIGKNIGEEVDVNVTFPEEYHAEELKGKPALFKVTVKEIKKKELPELDNDFVEDVSEFSTVDEYKASIKTKIEEKKADEAKSAKEEATIEKIIEGAKMEIPDAMVDSQVRQMAEDFARRISAQGLTIDQYFQYTGLTSDKLLEQMRPQALKRIQSRLVLEAVADKENFEVTDEDVNNEINDMASAYQMEADKLKDLLTDADKENMKRDIQVKKAVEFVTENAKEV